MSKADKNLIKAGVVNDELELTNSGRDLVVDLMFNNKDIKAEIAKMAEAIVKEQEDC
ncbi:MAG: hypothetical protein U9R08_01090 [Nanoarchaeota archaeon]|nr:hypothetical protein [Nanoarchaeota archaeon]